MDPITLTDPAITASSGDGVGLIGYDILSPLLAWLFGSGPLSGGTAGVFGFLSALWSIYAVLAYIFAAACLYLYVYASVRKGQLDELRDELLAHSEQLYDEQFRTGPKNDRLADVITHIATDNPNDWKLAIIEADIILDDSLKRAGYSGASLGERLRAISPAQLQTLDDAWQAHKVRNLVAHGNDDFVLTRRLAEDTIKQYRRVFDELGVS
ncbi:hypothetical protein K2Q16_02320 [Patescibacteria group bacterium]|nr:hypothetical protein [Patescibacteria group bacterium]